MFNFFTKNLSLASLVFALAACGGGGESTNETSTLTLIKPKKPTLILIFGDSISQGYGTNANGVVYQQISPGNTYAELLRLRIKNEKLDEFAPVTIVNDSLGAEFTSDGLKRLPEVLAYYQPTHVVLAHGTNDAASDTPLSTISNNFVAMINMAKGNGAKVLLADVTFSRYGADFASRYSKMISDTAFRLAATYVPLLKDVVGYSKYYLPDMIHPNDAAQNLIQDNLWQKLIPLME